MKQLDCIERLILMFTRLPGVGKKTAQRYAYGILDMPAAEVEQFIAAVDEAKKTVKSCQICGYFAEEDICPVCKTRDRKVICVVSYAKDVLAFERVSGYKGVYHVLGGTLSPLNGRGPDDLRIKELLARLDSVEEVIMATNPDVEGEATAVYIARLLKPLGIKVTRLAQGISLGSDIEYADEITLEHALTSRTEIA